MVLESSQDSKNFVYSSMNSLLSRRRFLGASAAVLGATHWFMQNHPGAEVRKLILAITNAISIRVRIGGDSGPGYGALWARILKNRCESRLIVKSWQSVPPGSQSLNATQERCRIYIVIESWLG